MSGDRVEVVTSIWQSAACIVHSLAAVWVGQVLTTGVDRLSVCALVLQARSLKDALVAMDRTMINIKEFAAWYSKYNFIAPGKRPCQHAQLALLVSTS